MLTSSAAIMKTTASHEEVQKAGIDIFGALYGIPHRTNPNEFRFQQFYHLGSSPKINHRSLCPTIGMADLHSRRVFSQI